MIVAAATVQATRWLRRQEKLPPLAARLFDAPLTGAVLLLIVVALMFFVGAVTIVSWHR